MSVNYASGLSPFEHKGKCGMTETFDTPAVLAEKLTQLSQWIQQSRHLVVITGAGISTAAGIPDFRGPKGVWTLEQRNETPQATVTFESAQPTFAHRALVSLEDKGILKYLVSQNVDGLHMRSGFPVSRLAELHGNMFVEMCPQCRCQYIRSHPVGTMALRPTGNICTQKKSRGNCRGRLRDTILDWEDALPVDMLDLSEKHCRQSDLCLCLGTTLQIVPCGNMPLLTKNKGGRVVIVNLQPTKHDKACHLKINAYIDDVMRHVCDAIGVTVAPVSKPHVTLTSRHIDENTRRCHIEVDACLIHVKGESDSKSVTISAEQRGKLSPNMEEPCRSYKDMKPTSVDIKAADMSTLSTSHDSAKTESRDLELPSVQNGIADVKFAAQTGECTGDAELKQEQRNITLTVPVSNTIDTDTLLLNNDFNLKRRATDSEADCGKVMKRVATMVTNV